ncbi:M50 family metallopeptidase [Cohnella fermenti]|uniref:M50 family metallopeptidase n=1 Tax=Cohnella fermenti TaxID=2565925 RepID=A0A4S4BL26_9BACL|nr:M50 family metallopeptidase [Cohnella fermenti]THF74850.1 M50 family metallopeptidase [Cohnella fermenti]
MTRWLKPILYLLLSVFLTRLIPFSSFFRNLDTMVHEFSHAVMALVLSGDVQRVELHADHSGVTYFRLASSWSHLPIALAGYIGASLFALLLFRLQASGKQKLGLILMSGIAALLLILYVHSGFGVYWLIGFLALNILALCLKKQEWLRNGYYGLLAFLTLEESAMGPVTLVLNSLDNSRSAGDAYSLQEITGLPALLWSIVFLLVALACVSRSLQLFAGSPSRPSARRSKGSGIWSRQRMDI